jgi:hypothetical protein
MLLGLTKPDKKHPELIGNNLQCTFLIRGWHGWPPKRGATDEECASIWVAARRLLDFVGVTTNMGPALDMM